MASEIDSLEIKIQADAKKAADSIDTLCNKIGTLQNCIKNFGSSSKVLNVDTNDIKVSNISKNISKTINEQAKALKAPMKDISSRFSAISDQFKDLGKGFQFFGDVQAAQKKVEALSNALEAAKLKKQELELAEKTDGTAYENAVKNVIKYTNQIDSLNSKIESMKNVDVLTMSDDEWMEFYNNLPTVKARAAEVSESIKESFSQISEPLKELDMTLANLSTVETESLSAPKIETKSFSENIGKLKEMMNSIIERFLEFKGRAGNTLVSIGARAYTKEYVELQNQITKTEKTLATLNEQMARSRATVKNFEATTSYRKMEYDIKLAREELGRLREEQDKLEVSGGATKWNFKGFSDGVKSVSKSLKSLQNALKKISSMINSVFSKVGKLAKSMFSLGNDTKKTNESFSFGFKQILKYGFGIRSLYVLSNKLRNSIKEGMGNLAQYSSETNASISLLMNSINQFKNASAAMASPLLNAIAPVLNQIIQLCIKAANAINQLFSALTGKSTWIKATKQNNNYASSLNGVAKAANKAKAGLRAFDELKTINMNDASGADGGNTAANMFETVPIESKFKELADKLKEIANSLFAPLKKAWQKDGKFVMDSWKYALDNVWKLTKDIGKDFLAVWNQNKTISMFSNILQIVGDIGLTAGHLARNFRKAWNENKTGLRILENIRYIFAVIIKNIKHAADATVKWADKIDFSPLLQAFEKFTKSLIPASDTLSGILTDLYEKVLLPLSKWTIEKGLPQLLDVFTSFNEKVDWGKLRSNLSELWNHLEPFAETVGEGLILFVERISDALANFINSQDFKDFLVSVENWMDKVTPEDVANGLEKLAKALIALKVAVTGLSVLSKVISPIKDFAISLILLKKAGAFANISTALSGISTAISGFLTTYGTTIAVGLGKIGLVIAAAWGGWNLGQLLNEKITGEEIDLSFFEQMNEIKNSFSDGSWKEAFSLWKDDIETNMIALAEDESQLLEPVKEKFNEFKDYFAEGQFADAMGLWKQDIENDLTDAKNKFDEWYNNKVKPIFDSKNWNFEGIKTGLSTAFDNAIYAMKQLWNGFADWLNSVLKFDIPPVNIGGTEIFGGAKIDLGKIPKFEAGGFPEDGLFYANHSELVGQFSNGKTAVANNEQIIGGIKEGVRSAVSDALSPYLREIAANTRETANKDFSITEKSIGKAASNYANDYYRRTGKNAYQF